MCRVHPMTLTLNDMQLKIGVFCIKIRGRKFLFIARAPFGTFHEFMRGTDTIPDKMLITCVPTRISLFNPPSSKLKLD